MALGTAAMLIRVEFRGQVLAPAANAGVLRPFGTWRNGRPEDPV